jgi:hypothetical protein
MRPTTRLSGYRRVRWKTRGKEEIETDIADNFPERTKTNTFILGKSREPKRTG